MQQLTSQYFRFMMTGILLAVLFTTMTTFTVSAHTVTPMGVTVQTMTTPLLKTQNSNMKVNKKGEIIYSPDHLRCNAQVQNIFITNTTSQTIDLYLNSVFQLSILPGGLASTLFNYPGTDIFTIPNTNPNARLTVTVKPYSTPNSYLKPNERGNIVFSPHRLICSYYGGACLSITNKTHQKMSIYLNCVFNFTIYPNQVYNAILDGPGTYIFTIPDINPNTKLTVIGQ